MYAVNETVNDAEKNTLRIIKTNIHLKIVKIDFICS